MSTTVAKLVAEIDATGVTKGVTELAKVAPEAVKAEAGVDRLKAASKGLDQAMLQAVKAINDNTAAVRALIASNDAGAASMNKVTSSATAYAASLRESSKAAASAATGWTVGAKQLDAHVIAFNKARESAEKFSEAQGGVVKMSGRSQAGLLNLSRQFTDVGVTAAMGMNPLMILIQQGPQIADALGEVKAGGMGVAAAFRQVAAAVWVALAPFLPFLAAATAVATVLGSGFLLAARNANKETGDLTKGLGLTADQMEKVKQKTVTVGDTFAATFTVIGRHIMDGPIGKAFDWIGEKWGQLLDAVTRGGIAMAAGIAASFQAAAAAMKGQNFGQAFSENFGRNKAGMNSFFGEITDEAASSRRKKILKEAGKAPKGPADPRDQTDERTAQVDQALAGAMQDELQARLALTKDVMARAEIEKQIRSAALEEKQAQVEKQIAAIGDDKGLSAAKKAELIAQLAIVEALNQSAALMQQRQVDLEAEASLIEANATQRQRIAGYYDRIASLSAELAGNAAAQNRIEDAALVSRQRVEQQTLDAEQSAAILRASQDAVETAKLKSSQAAERVALGDLQAVERQAQARKASVRATSEAAELERSALQSRIDLLASTEGLAKSSYARSQIALRILPLEQELERLKLVEIVATSKAGSAEQQRAQLILDHLPEVQANQRRALEENASFAQGLADAATATADFVQQLKHGDIGTATQSFANVLNQVSGLMGPNSGLGQALGSAAAFLGPAGAIASAVGSVLGAIFSSNKVIGQVRLSSEDQRALQGVGTVLGSFSEQSASISKSLDRAETYQDKDLGYGSAQASYLREIRDNIGSLTAAIGRQIGVAGGAFDTSGLGLGSFTSKSGDILSGLVGLLTGKKKTTTTLVDQGINLGSGSLDDYASGKFGGNYYQDTQTVVEKSKLFGFIKSATTTNNESTQDLDGGITRGVARVVSSMRDSVLGAAKTIGISTAQDLLDGFKVEIGRISLDGLSSAEITQQLTAVFSKVGDDLAERVMPGLERFQLAGEGAFETLQRLATEFTTLDGALSAIGQSLGVLTGLASLDARKALIDGAGGLDALTGQVDFFSEHFLTAAERIAPAQRYVTESLAALNLGWVDTREEFAQVVRGLDLTTTSGQTTFNTLMKLAPAFDVVTSSAEDLADANLKVWTDTYNTAQKGVDTARSSLQTAYDDAAGTITGLADRYQSVADGLGKTLSDLATGDIGGASIATRYRNARAELDRTGAQAGLGDAAAGEALPGVISQFLAVSKDNAKSRFEVLRDAALARSIAQKAQDVALRQVDIQKASLQALKDQVSGLGIVTDTVKAGSDNIVSAIANLAAAMAKESAAGARLDPQWGAIANVGINQQLAAATGYTGAFGTGGFQSYITSDAGAAYRDVAKQILSGAGQDSRIIGFATGGDHIGGARIVGERGPELELTGPSRIISNDRLRGMMGGNNAGMESRLDAMLARLDRIEKNTGEGARHGKKTADTIVRVTEDGDAMNTRAA